MAAFYDVPVNWKCDRETKGRDVGNNVAWLCACEEILLGPHEGLYQIGPCPKCGRSFRIVRGQRPRYVDHVEEV